MNARTSLFSLLLILCGAAVAQGHNIPQVYDRYEQLLDDPSLEVLDIAVAPNAQLGFLVGART